MNYPFFSPYAQTHLLDRKRLFMLDISVTSLHFPKGFLFLMSIGGGRNYFGILCLTLGCHERTGRKEHPKGREVY